MVARHRDVVEQNVALGVPTYLGDVLIDQVATASIWPPFNDHHGGTRFEIVDRWDVLSRMKFIDRSTHAIKEIQLHATGGTKTGTFGQLLTALVAEHGRHDTPTHPCVGAKAQPWPLCR